MTWLLAPFGVGIALHAAFLIIRGLQSRRWPTTLGSFLDVGAVGGGENPVELRLSYAYYVGDRRFVASRVSYGRPVYLQTYVAPGLQAQEQFGDLRQLTVYYDPRNPERAVLRPGIEGPVLVEFLVGLCFTWLAV